MGQIGNAEETPVLLEMPPNYPLDEKRGKKNSHENLRI